MYLCQVNTSEILYPVTDPRFLRFSAGARIINRKIKSAKGFICGEQIYDNDRLFITRSVWESPEDLVTFIFSGTHRKFMGEASTWFRSSEQPSLALWFSSDPALPELDLCERKLEQLREFGESDNLKGAGWLSQFA
jgi:hypothetical protein